MCYLKKGTWFNLYFFPTFALVQALWEIYTSYTHVYLCDHSKERNMGPLFWIMKEQKQHNLHLADKQKEQ